mgnify:CR=1 FL=1
MAQRVDFERKLKELSEGDENFAHRVRAERRRWQAASLVAMDTLRGGLKDPGWDSMVKTVYDRLPAPEEKAPPLDVREEFVEMTLDNERFLVHRIHMTVRDGQDKSGSILTMFDIPAGRAMQGNDGPTVTQRPRRFVLPYFEWDPKTGWIVGEEEERTTLEERLACVVAAGKERGFDVVGPSVSGGAAFANGHVLWITQDGPGYRFPSHAMGYVPYNVQLDDMHLAVPARMIRATFRGW